MKIVKKIKVILACITCTLLLVGCNVVEMDKDSKPNIYKKMFFAETPVLFEFNGHEYIRFNFTTHSNPVVHNPDCPCLKNKKD